MCMPSGWVQQKHTSACLERAAASDYVMENHWFRVMCVSSMLHSLTHPFQPKGMERGHPSPDWQSASAVT